MNIAFYTGVIFAERWPLILMATFLVIVLAYALRRRLGLTGRTFQYTAYALTAFFVVRIVVLVAAQYWAWSTTLPGRYFLPPYQPISYFLQYSFTHYAASTLLTLALALGIAGVLTALRRYRPPVFADEDIPLFFSIMMLIGWPLSFAYVWAVLFCAAAVLAARQLLRRDPTYALGLQLLFSALPFLVFENELITALHLETLVMPG